MTKSTKPSGGRPEIELGGLFRGLGEAVDLLGKLVETGGTHTREGEFSVKGLGDKARGVYGFSIRVAKDLSSTKSANRWPTCSTNTTKLW
jgi:HSP20 family protein